MKPSESKPESGKKLPDSRVSLRIHDADNSYRFINPHFDQPDFFINEVETYAPNSILKFNFLDEINDANVLSYLDGLVNSMVSDISYNILNVTDLIKNLIDMTAYNPEFSAQKKRAKVASFCLQKLVRFYGAQLLIDPELQVQAMQADKVNEQETAKDQKTEKKKSGFQKIFRRLVLGLTATSITTGVLGVASAGFIDKKYPGGVHGFGKDAIIKGAEKLYPNDQESQAFIALYFHRIEHHQPVLLDDLHSLLESDTEKRHLLEKAVIQNWGVIDTQEAIVKNAEIEIRNRDKQLKAAAAAATPTPESPTSSETPTLKLVVENLRVGTTGTINADQDLISYRKKMLNVQYLVDEVFKQNPNFSVSEKAELEFIIYQLKTILLGDSYVSKNQGINLFDFLRVSFGSLDPLNTPYLDAAEQLPPEINEQIKIFVMALVSDNLSGIEKISSPSLRQLSALISNQSASSKEKMRLISQVLLNGNLPVIKHDVVNINKQQSEEAKLAEEEQRLQFAMSLLKETDLKQVENWEIKLILTLKSKDALLNFQKLSAWLHNHQEIKSIFTQFYNDTMTEDIEESFLFTIDQYLNSDLFSRDKNFDMLVFFLGPTSESVRNFDKFFFLTEVATTLFKNKYSPEMQNFDLAGVVKFAKDNHLYIGAVLKFCSDYHYQLDVTYLEQVIQQLNKIQVKLLDLELVLEDNAFWRNLIMKKDYKGQKEALQYFFFLYPLYYEDLNSQTKKNSPNGTYNLATFIFDIFDVRGNSLQTEKFDSGMKILEVFQRFSHSELKNFFISELLINRSLPLAIFENWDYFSSIQKKYGISDLLTIFQIKESFDQLHLTGNLDLVFQAINNKSETYRDKYAQLTVMAIANAEPNSLPPAEDILDQIWDYSLRSDGKVDYFFGEEIFKQTIKHQDLKENIKQIRENHSWDLLYDLYNSSKTQNLPQLVAGLLKLDQEGLNKLKFIFPLMRHIGATPKRDPITMGIHYFDLFTKVKAKISALKIEDELILSAILMLDSGHFHLPEDLINLLPDDFSALKDTSSKETIAALSNRTLDLTTARFDEKSGSSDSEKAGKMRVYLPLIFANREDGQFYANNGEASIKLESLNDHDFMSLFNQRDAFFIGKDGKLEVRKIDLSQSDIFKSQRSDLEDIIKNAKLFLLYNPLIANGQVIETPPVQYADGFDRFVVLVLRPSSGNGDLEARVLYIGGSHSTKSVVENLIEQGIVKRKEIVTVVAGDNGMETNIQTVNGNTLTNSDEVTSAPSFSAEFAN